MNACLRQLLAAILSFAIAAPMCAASYVYDPVGNRTQKTSTIPGYPGGLLNYNANDQLSTDTGACPERSRRDANGNTTASVGLGYGYDFENHLIRAGAGVTLVYDGDGNRVSKTVAGVTTKYLVDTQSPTGYAQVISEAIAGNTTQPYDYARAYVYGLELVSEYRQFVANNQSGTQISYYVYDGHGSVRALTNPSGAVTDTYDYDAFGNLIHSTGTTPNNYLFAGEQFDPDLGLYYNRARYLNMSTGRFWTMDQYEGNTEDPLSLHKYLYVSASPVDRIDPSGNQDLASFSIGSTIGNVLNNITAIQGQAVMEQLQYGGNAGLRSLLVATGFIVGSVVVLRVVGGAVRYINAALYSLDARTACEGFSQAAEYGILPWKDLDAVVPVGSGLEKHHLIEQRFAATLGVSAGDIPAIALTEGEHQVFTNAWRDAIGYINGKNPVNTATATVDQIWAAAQKVYEEYPNLLEYIQRFMNK